MLSTDANILVATDALLEGRGDAAETIVAPTRATVRERALAIGELVASAKHAKFPTLGRERVEIRVGRLYLKIIVGGSVWAMVSLSDGLIWSSMCGKPVTNYPRGCVHDVEASEKLATGKCYGIAGTGAYHDLG